MSAKHDLEKVSFSFHMIAWPSKRCSSFHVIYSDAQNYVYSGKFFLSQPLLQWKKWGKNLEMVIRVEQASEHKKINFAQCKIKNF